MGAPQLQTYEEGQELARRLQAGEVHPSRVAEAEAALNDLKQRLEGEKTGAEADAAAARALEISNAQRVADVDRAFGMVAETPVGSPLIDPASRSGHPVGLGRVRPPAPDEPWLLANQARERGVDIHTGAPPSERFGQGLANLKDPQLRHFMLDRYYREQLREKGIDWPETVPVIMVEEQTGELAAMAPVDKDKDPRNAGKARLTLINAPGMDLGDLYEFAPVIPTAAAQVGSALAIGAFTKNVHAANIGSAAATAFFEGLSSPAKDYLLKNYYNLTQEQIDAYSNPNEALRQAVFAGGMDLAMGELMVLNHWRKNRQAMRTLTREDYKEMVDDLQGMRQTYEDFREVTGTQLDDSHVLVQAAANKRGTLGAAAVGTKTLNLVRRLSDKAKRILGNAEQVARVQIKRGLDAINNKHVTDAYDPANLGMKDGVYVPAGDATERAHAVHKILDEDAGLPGTRRIVADTEEAAERAYDELADRHNPLNYVDIQSHSANRVSMAYENEQLQWELFKDVLEPNAAGVNNIVVTNPPQSPIRRALSTLDKEAAANFSQKLGGQTKNLAQDLERLQAGTLDIQELQRLRSNLSHAREMARNSDAPDWNTHDINAVIEAIDTHLDNMPWVRQSSGKEVPAQQRAGLYALQRARDATRYVNQVARRDFIDTITRQIDVFDHNALPVAGRRQFTEMPTQVRQKLFEPYNEAAMRDFLDLAGHDPRFRAALADELEGMYKRQVLNENGTFKAGAFQEFQDMYGGHMAMVFGPDNAARITTADQMQRAVVHANKVAKQVEDAFVKEFGDMWEGAASQGIVRTVMGSNKISAAQVDRFMRRLNRMSPELAESTRAEFTQWMGGKLYSSPITTKGAGAFDELINTSGPKIKALMGQKYLDDLGKVRNALSIVDMAAQSAASPESVQQAWLQITRSLFGPLSRKQRFMTAFNRVARNRGAEKALELMSDPETLRRFVKLKDLDPTRTAFWAEVRALGLTDLMEEFGVQPPEDLAQMAAREADLRRVRMFGSNL